ncbi:MAG: Cache 3/Cache 2 fusion domain-containing protein [Proteobacteria bacterium]|nr:Cache 3/Cache 2 fusion domain-containing protein [Pseudomonadota bacterium]
MLVIILILVGITYNSTKIITEKTVESHQHSIAAETAKTVELWLARHLDILEATAITVQEITIDNNFETLLILKMAMKAGDFSDVYIGLKDGTMIDGADWIAPKGYDPRIRPWYRKAVKENKITFTTPYLDMTTEKMVIAIVKPLVVNHQFIGVISSDIILDALGKNVANAKIGNSGYTFIIDSQGLILVHPDQKLLMTTKIQESDKSLKGVLDHFKATASGTYYYNYRGEEKILSFQRLSNTGWFLCTTVQKKEAYTLAKNIAMLFAMGMVFKILGILAVLLLLVIGISVLIISLTKHRFEAIVKQHKQLMSGKDKDLKGEIILRKEIETRYQTLFNVSTNAIMLSKKFSFIECNEKTMDMFGLDHDQIVGKSMLDLSPAIQQDGRESKAKFDQIIKNLVAGEQKIFEWAFNRSDGTEFPTEVGLKALRLDSEMVTLYSIWDISKRANVEHQLRQAQKMAAMGEMLSAIAHQWRQPLNVLSTYIASLPSAFYNNMISKKFIEKMVKESDFQIQFMSRTINDFGQYFRPSKTKQTFEVYDSIENAVKLIKPQLKQNGITLQINESHDVQELLVFGYKNEFVHVLVNIISNAKDAINEKQEKTQRKKILRKIELSVKTEDHHVVLGIKDTGCGIPTNLLTKIFTPYFTTKGIATGTGIGLYMAKMIVEKEMEGQIIVENLPSGTQFIIKLPLSDLKRKDHA